MATLIGVVSQVIGEVYAVAGDGTRRPLSEGDRVFAGEQIVTGASGSIAVAMSNGQQLTLGRDSSLNLNEQMLAGSSEPQNPTAETPPAAPSDGELTDVEKLQAAIEAGVDPTLEGEATAAGPGAGGGGGGAGGAGGGHSFVLLGETGGALDPVIGFPTAGFSTGPEFPNPEPEVGDPDFSPTITIEYRDAEGSLVTGPGIVDEEALLDGTNPGSDAEETNGAIIIDSPDGISSLQIQGFNGVWVDVTAGGVVQGQYGTLTVDAAGNWTYTLTDNTLDHTDPNATGADDQLGESFPVRVFDLDGDVSPTVLLNVLVNDDGPILSEGEQSSIRAIVDEDETIDGNSDGDGVTNVATGGPGTLSALVNFGADGIGSFGLSGLPSAIATLEAQGLTSGTTALTYAVVGDTLTASAGAETIFTLQVGGDGSFTFTLVGQLDHPTPDGNDDEMLDFPIDFSGVLTATDGDGDSVGSFNEGSFVIGVEDDVPVLAGFEYEEGDGEYENSQSFISRPSVGGIVHEDALTIGGEFNAPYEGNNEDTDGVGQDDDSAQTVTLSGGSGALSVLVNFGADGPGDFGISTDLSGLDAQMLRSGGVLLTYGFEGDMLVAKAGSVEIFTLSVDGDGGYEFVLKGPLDHPVHDGDFDSEDLPGLGIDFSSVLTATDGDGDPLVGGFPRGSFYIDVEDDVPTAVQPTYSDNQQTIPLVMAQVDEDELPGGIGDGDAEGTSASGASGTLTAMVNFGADGPGVFGLSNSLAAIESMEDQGLSSGGTALTYSVVGDVLTAFAGVNPVFTLQVNDDGSYSFNLSGPLDHPLPGSTDDGQMLNLPIDFSGVLTATDGDGDPVSGFVPGSFVVEVEDDVPLAQNDNATVLAGEGLDFNAVFVLDFSGSIDNAELNTMLEAVRAAGQALFSGTTGDVNIQIVAFSGDSNSYPVLTDFASFSALIDSLNPADGGTRPFSGQTDFTDGIQETMAAYTPIPGWSNQVFFISDGNPNEQTGTGGNSLSDATAAAWNTFVDSNGINVTTIGVGNGINGTRLQDVDLDGNGAPILVDNFDDLIDTLVDQVIGGLVGGNVLLGNDNAVGGGDDDAFGADGPGQILSIDINGVVYTWDGAGNIDASSGPDIAGNQLTDIDTAEGGKLSFNFSSGAWSYQAPASVSGDKTETFTYTIIDNDGDPSTANLSVYVEDTSPVIAAVDEDELPGGITDGDAVTTVATGSLSDLVVGPPVAAQFTLSTDTSGLAPATSNGVALVYGVVGNVLTATAGAAGPTVFTLQVQSNGDYTFTLSGPLDHPAAGTDDSELLVMNFASILEASDGVDPLALAGDFLVQIENDVPAISAVAAPNDSLQVDETNLALNSTANFGSLFTSNYGGDGPGTTAFSLQISAPGANTGLDDVATGNSIFLFMQGNDVVGRVSNAGGPIVFRVSVNSSTGAVTLDQLRAIEHSPNTTADQEASLAFADQIKLVGTIIDDDGDSSSATVNLGSAISFKDDGPSISASAVAAGSLRVDESDLGDNDTDDFSSLFTTSYGADGAGDIDYDLSVSAPGADSGLDDTATGQNILLYMQGNDVVGRVGGPAGAIAFRVSVDGSGDVTLDQQRAIVHTPNTGPDQAASLAAANLIKLTATITDEDGDSASSTIDIGHSLAFEDDAPEIDGRSVSNDTLQVDETNLLANDSHDFSGNFDDDYGADGAGTTVYSLNVSATGANSGLDDTATGQDILLYNEGGMIVGRVGGPGGDISFTVSVNSTTGVVTLDQQRAIFHTPNTDSNQESSLASANLIQLSATITDKDGDTDSATINLGNAISFRDDGPSLNSSAPADNSLQVDETTLATDVTVNYAGQFSGGYGADGAGTTVYSLSVSASGANSGLDDTATGSDILLYMQGNDVVGRVGGPAGLIAFRVSVNGSGQVTLDQQRAIEHEPNTTHDQESSLAAANLVRLTATITDKDGDSDSETINLGSAISFKDDGPTISSNAQVQLDDDALANGIPNGPNDNNPDAVNTSGTLGHNFGADGAGSVQWLTSGAPSGFTYAAGPGGSLLVKQGATTVLTVTLNSASGAYTVTQNAPIQHANADLENNQAFTLNYRVTDKDGDTADGTLAINVDDDTPFARNDVASVAASQDQDFNVAFVLDSSGSISNTAFNTMMNAVKAAGQELFNGTNGDVKVTIVAFSSDSLPYAPVTTLAAFNAQVDSIIANRPFSGGTDFTDGIQETMASYVPIPGASNQVFFISDGNPNEQTGTGGNSLSDATAAAWNTFVDSNGINVTTIGVGDGINLPRLQDVDLDGAGAPILVGNFDDLIDTLLGQIGALVSGNVLLGSDNAVGGGDDDGYGADGPGYIQSIVINGITYVWNGAGTIDPSSGPNIAGNQLTDIATPEGGTLDFNFSTGAWTYQAPSNVSGDKTETFTYSIVDKDGDPSTATLTVYVEDSSPVEGYVDEDNLPSGIVDPDAVTDVATGSVVSLVVGPDAGSQFSLSNAPADIGDITAASSGGVALVYSVLGNTLTATAGPAGPVVFTLQVASNGDYTFNLDKALDHPLDGSNDAQLLTLDFSSILLASNGVNPLALAGGFLIHVEDDIPLIDAGLSGQLPAALNTQDAQTISTNTDSASSNFSAAFSATANHGADGPGVVSWSYSLGLLVAEGALSGMSSNNLTVKLYESGGVITGSTAGSEAGVGAGNTIFTLSVNGAGLVTLNQFAEIDHNPGGATSNYDAQEAILASNLIGLTGTASITDYDGDTHVDSAVLDLGGKVAFDDDGPSISLGFGTSPVPVLNTQDAQTIGMASDSDSASFSSAFNITASSYGADGAGTIATVYSLTMLAAEGTSAGLSSDGATIYLYENAGVITGSTSASEAGVDGSNSVFTLSVNGSGQVTLTQLKEIDHNPGGATSNYSAQEAILGSNLVGLKATVTITDGDGDTATANQTLDLGGKVAFDDDGPSISLGLATSPAPVLNTQDAQTIGIASDSDSASFSSAFNITASSYGADGAGTIATAYSLTMLAAEGASAGLSSDGATIYLYENAGVITGSTSASEAGVDGSNSVFTLSVNGSGQVTLTQLKEIDHNPGGATSNYSAQEAILGSNLIGLKATVTITDGDGDTATANQTLDLGGKVAFDDDGPSVSATAPGSNSLQVDETNLLGDVTVNYGGLFSPNYGADGAGTTVYSLSVSAVGVDSGLDDSASGSNILLYNEAGVIVGRVGGVAGAISFTVSVNASGQVTLDQQRAIMHTPNTTADQASSLASDALVKLSATVTDGDGDTAMTTVNLGSAISFKDDGPTTSSNATVQLDDDALANGIPNGTGDDSPNSVNTSGMLGLNFGADGAGTVQWQTSGAPGGFTYAAGPAGSLLISQGATLVLTVTMNSATGAYTVTQNAAIQHATANQENNQAFTLTYQVTDKDGDSATGTLAISVDDDAPLAQNDSASVAEGSGEDFNVAFVLDSSGSISNSEFSTMMNAVKAAGQALFNGTSGDVKVTIVAFSSDSLAYAPVTTLAAFNAQVDSIIASRPFSGSTDFTDGIQETMAVYSPISGWSNQVFFISDGNPNEQTGTGGNSLSDATAAAWNTFVDSNGINVTTIGVGDGINNARLQDVDLDGSGAPILVTDFDDLIDTLLDQIAGGDVSGNVLLGNNNAVGGGDDDGFGADGAGRIQSISINGITYVWDGGAVIDPSSGPNIAGNSLSNIATAMGGKLNFSFATGAWSYVAPVSVNADTNEVFTYTILDKDGDPSSANLTVTILDVNQAPSGTSATLSIAEDSSKVFSAADFGFSDSDGDSLLSVKITTLPAVGSLTYNGGAVPAEIAVGNLGLLVYTPAPNASGNGYASFTFQVRDDGGTVNGGVNLDATPNQITFNVTPVNDAPTATISNVSYNATEDVSLVLKGTGLSVADIDAGSGSVTVTLSVGQGRLTGTAGNSGVTVGGNNTAALTLSGTLAQVNAFLGAAGTSTLSYTAVNAPAATTMLALLINDNGNTGSGGSLSAIDTAVINITPASDPTDAIGDDVRTNVGNVSVAIPEWALTWNDTDADGRLDVSAIGSIVGGTASQTTGTSFYGSVNFNDNNGNTGGGNSNSSFSYTATDGSSSDSATVSILLDTSGALDGNNSSNILVDGIAAANSTLNGSDGNDILIGNDGNDTLNGGDDNDLLVGGSGNDALNGNADNDTAGYFDAGSGVTVSLALAAQQDTIGAGLDTLSSIENLIGSRFGDTLTGSSGSNSLIGLEGDDILIGNGGSDSLTGSAGEDTFKWLSGNTGVTTITDFVKGVDSLDLSQLLSGEDDTASSLSQYLTFSFSTDTTITVDSNAAAGGGTGQSIVLQGINLQAAYGVADAAGVITAMLGDDSLKVDAA